MIISDGRNPLATTPGLSNTLYLIGSTISQAELRSSRMPTNHVSEINALSEPSPGKTYRALLQGTVQWTLCARCFGFVSSTSRSIYRGVHAVMIPCKNH